MLQLGVTSKKTQKPLNSLWILGSLDIHSSEVRCLLPWWPSTFHMALCRGLGTMQEKLPFCRWLTSEVGPIDIWLLLHMSEVTLQCYDKLSRSEEWRGSVDCLKQQLHHQGHVVTSGTDAGWGFGLPGVAVNALLSFKISLPAFHSTISLVIEDEENSPNYISI